MGRLPVVFGRRTSLPSWLTRMLTGGARWSHCGVLDVARGVVIEALWFRGVVETPLAIWMLRYPSWERVDITCPDAPAAMAFVRAQVGKGYDYLAVLGVPWRSAWDDPRRWYCSELVEAALATGGRRRWRLSKRGVSPMESWLVL
ncbi:MAG: hypothetical protein ACK4F7_03940 [Inhella sp.]